MLRRVVGISMTPTLYPGQVVYIRRWFYKPQINDIVMVRHGGLEKIKRVTRIEAGGLYITGDNPQASTDSRQFGLVPLQSVLGKVIQIF